MEQFETKARARITEYTASGFVFLAALVFFTSVPFLPDSPVVPGLVGLALAGVSMKNRGAAVASLYLLVFIATLWQMIGFGFFQLLRAGVGVAVLVAMIAPLFFFYSRKVELTSMSIGVLCVSLLFTPAYFVSVPLIAASAAVTGFASLEAISLSFVLFAFPFLLLDNALYFLTTSHASTPIAFAQLTYLSQNLRPPLPGLNLFLNALPHGYISPLAPEVSSFLTSNWELLVVPLFLIGLTIILSSSVGGLARRFLKGFAAMREWKNWDRLWNPIAVSLIVPAVFIVLIISLSLPGAGDFQTGLTGDATHIQIALTLASAAVLGLAFVGREFLVVRLEGVEVNRTKVLNLVTEARTAMEAAKAEVAQIQKNIPVVNTSLEEHTLTEQASYVNDVQRRAKDAGIDTLYQWGEHLEKSVLPSLMDAKTRLKAEVLNEFSTLRGVVEAVNGHLKEALAPQRYTSIPEIESGIPLDDLTELYQLSAKRIEDETSLLFSDYSSTLEALNRLLELKGVTIPVSPDPLLESHDYVTAMRLVSEDYWLNFHLRYTEELQEKLAPFIEQMSRLSASLETRDSAQVGEILAKVQNRTPADSVMLLGKVEEMKDFLSLLLTRLAEYPETTRKTIESINPAASEILTFQTARRKDELLAVEEELHAREFGIQGLTKIIGDAIPVVSGQASAMASDREGMIILAHYPAARRGIRRALSGGKAVSVEQLPYEKQTAAIFLRLYAAEVPSAKYDESGGVLSPPA